MSETMRIPAHQVSPSLRALFDVGQPLALRCFAVLDGSIRGQIWTDDPAQTHLGRCPGGGVWHPVPGWASKRQPGAWARCGTATDAGCPTRVMA